MLADLINRNSDLQKLQDDGYSLEFVQKTGLHLLVHDVPYLNAQRTIKVGTLICPISLKEDGLTNASANHQAWFMGEHPCTVDGVPISGIAHSNARQDMGDGIWSDHSFSTKPPVTGVYQNYHEKVTHYINVISAPARYVDPAVTAKLHKPILTTDDSVFLYADTASTRAGIGALAGKLSHLRIAIVGLGGTGSFILDQVAKTHVREIHLFDGDVYFSHNAYRAPGATSVADLQTPEPKVIRYSRIYGEMRRGVIPHAEFVTEENVAQLADFDFVFISVDKGAVRELIAQQLIASKVPFIDVGMHIQMTKDASSLIGQLRTTLCSPEKNDHFSRRVPVDDTLMENEYGTNIQVTELNALNAILAVIRWKKYFGIYDDRMQEHESVYAINTHMLTKDEKA